MRKFNLIMVLCLLVAIPVAVQSQSTATTLTMRASFDDGSPAQGTVTLGLVHVVGSDTIVATKTLSGGYATVAEKLNPKSLYNVTLTSSNGKQLLKFPITTVLINPDNLSGAQIQVVFRKSDNSLKSAHFDVSMGF